MSRSGPSSSVRSKLAVLSASCRYPAVPLSGALRAAAFSSLQSMSRQRLPPRTCLSRLSGAQPDPALDQAEPD